MQQTFQSTMTLAADASGHPFPRRQLWDCIKPVLWSIGLSEANYHRRLFSFYG